MKSRDANKVGSVRSNRCGVAPVANTAAAVPEEQHFLLSNLSPSLAQRRLALAVVLALLAAAFATTAGALSSIQPGRIGAFVPAYATAIFVTDLLTAALLFAQFSILRSRALLAIASGYLYTALIVIPWMLACEKPTRLQRRVRSDGGAARWCGTRRERSDFVELTRYDRGIIRASRDSARSFCKRVCCGRRFG